MNKTKTRRSQVYGTKTPAPSMRFDKQLLADSKAMAASRSDTYADFTEYVERAIKFQTLLLKHQDKAPVIYYGEVAGKWFCQLPDHNETTTHGPDPLSALEAALRAEE